MQQDNKKLPTTSFLCHALSISSTSPKCVSPWSMQSKSTLRARILFRGTAREIKMNEFYIIFWKLGRRFNSDTILWKKWRRIDFWHLSLVLISSLCLKNLKNWTSILNHLILSLKTLQLISIKKKFKSFHKGILERKLTIPNETRYLSRWVLLPLWPHLLLMKSKSLYLLLATRLTRIVWLKSLKRSV